MERTAAIVVQAMQAFYRYEKQGNNGTNNTNGATSTTNEDTNSEGVDLLGMPKFGFDKIMLVC